jgi:hypothetical protein
VFEHDAHHGEQADSGNSLQRQTPAWPPRSGRAVTFDYSAGGCQDISVKFVARAGWAGFLIKRQNFLIGRFYRHFDSS